MSNALKKVAAVLGRLFGLSLRIWLNLRGQSNQIEFKERVDTYRKTWQQAAGELGAEFRELDDSLWEISLGERRARFANYRVELDNPVTLHLAGRKALVHKLLSAHGIEIPRHRVFTLDDLSAAENFFDQSGGTCVVKPENGFGGKGVKTHIGRRRQVRVAAMLASLYSQRLLIENQLFGESCRLLIVDGEFAHAVKRAGIRIVGNGRDNVRALIRKQIQPVSGARKFNIDKCPDVRFCLRHQSIGLDDVPHAGQAILARSSAVFSVASFENRTEYTDDITTEICDSLKKTAEECALIIGSRYLGVDIITPDITLSLSQCGGAVNEVNTTPALHHHLNLDTPASRGVARQVVQRLLKINGQSSATTPSEIDREAQR